MGDVAALARLASDALTGGHHEHDIRYWRTTARKLATYVHDHVPAPLPLKPASLDEIRIALFQAFNPGFDFGPDHPDWDSYGRDAETLIQDVHAIQASTEPDFEKLSDGLRQKLWAAHFPDTKPGNDGRYWRYYGLVADELVKVFTGRAPDPQKAGFDVAAAVLGRFHSSIDMLFPDDITPSGRVILLRVVAAAKVDLDVAKQANL